MWHTLRKWNFFFCTVFMHCVQSFMHMSTKGKKMQQNYNNSIIYFSKSLVWNEILYFHSYWKRSLKIIGTIFGRTLGGHLLCPSLLTGSFLVVSYGCLSELLSIPALICSALGRPLTYNLFFPVPNPCWKSYSFLGSSANLFIFLMRPCCREKRKNLPMSLKSVAQVAVYPALAWKRLSLLFLHFLH